MLLFEAPSELNPVIREILERIKAANTDAMTPVQAMALLDELVRKARRV
jgi:hypothetical protein